VFLDQGADPRLTESHVAPLVCDGAREGVGELRVCRTVAGVHHLEDVERHALEDDVLPDDAGHEVLLIDLLEQGLRELHQVRVREALEGFLELRLLDAEVVQALREDLDVPGLVQRLGGEEALAGLVGGCVHEARRGGQGTTLAEDELDRGADRLLAQDRILDHELRLVLARSMTVLGVDQIALGG
jgi:hypothetical protein